MYKLKDLMNMLGVSERTIRRHLKNNVIKGTKIGGVWRFSDEQLKEYFDNENTKTELMMSGKREVIDFLNESRNIENKNSCLIVDIKELSMIRKNQIVMFSNKLTKPFELKYYQKNDYHRFMIVGDKNDVSKFLNFINN